MASYHEPPLIDPRAPAHAVRALIEQQGRATPRALYEHFDVFNKDHFGGLLQQPMILLITPASPRTEGDYVARDDHGIPSRIRIAPRCVKSGMLYVADVLLHEMIHAWQAEQDNDLEPGYKGHGPRFSKKANEIGERLGLAAVAPKGRGGLPRPENWPSNVRPAGYYQATPGVRGRPRKPRQAARVDPMLEGLGEPDRELVAMLSRATGRPAGVLIAAWAREHARAVAQSCPAIAATLGAK